MRFNLLQFTCLSAVLLVLGGCLLATASWQPARERKFFKLPNLFDFNHFKSLFEKHYTSAVEELVRQKIYLGRAFKAFISMVQYRYYKSHTYLSISVRSDETLDERQRRRVTQISAIMSNTEQIPVGDLESIKNEFEELRKNENKEKSGYREILLELERADNLERRRKRNLDEQVRKISLNQLIGPQKLPEESTKISAFVPSNNPLYEPLELRSSAANIDTSKVVAPPLQGDGKPPGTIWDGLISQWDNWEPVRYIKEVVAQAIEGFQRPPTGKTTQPDVVYADLRTTNCLFIPRDQGQCASCYAFMIIALYEYLYCRATGKLVPFSEQYMLDCGSRTGLSGCAGGNMAASALFVHRYGLEMRYNYPYVAREDSCPYERDTAPLKMGYIRTDAGAGFEDIQTKYFDEYLEAGRPIAFSLSLNAEFDDYGGGVDQLRECNRDFAHGMLIVGHGRQDGQDYYLLRNSYSVSWGEQGYYKLAKRAAWRCSLFMGGMVVAGSFGNDVQGDRKNEERLSEKMEQRYGERLVKFKEHQLAEMLEDLLKEEEKSTPSMLPVAPVPSLQATGNDFKIIDLKST